MVENNEGLEAKVVRIFGHRKYKEKNPEKKGYKISIPGIDFKELANIDYVQEELQKVRMSEKESRDAEIEMIDSEIEALEVDRDNRQRSLNEKISSYPKLFKKLAEGYKQKKAEETGKILLKKYESFWNEVNLIDSTHDPQDLLTEYEKVGEVCRLYALKRKSEKPRADLTKEEEIETLKLERSRLLRSLNGTRNKYTNNFTGVDSIIYESLKGLILRIYSNAYSEATTSYIYDETVLDANIPIDEQDFKDYVERRIEKIKNANVNSSNIEKKIKKLEKQRKKLTKNKRVLSKKQEQDIILNSLLEKKAISQDIYEELKRPDETLNGPYENHKFGLVMIKGNDIYSINALFNDDEDPIAQNYFVHDWIKVAPGKDEGKWYRVEELFSIGIDFQEDEKPKSREIFARYGLFGNIKGTDYMLGFIKDSYPVN